MFKRLLIYFNEMFPVPAVIGTIFTGVAIELIYLRLFDIKPELSLHLVLPGIFLMCISLLVRVMDEFKDFQDDLTNFPHRPLPSGRVKPRDLKFLGWGCVFLAVFVSLFSTKLLLWSLVVLIYAALMLKWFFIEPIMRKSLPLAFISHHPIVLLNFIYVLLFCGVLYPQVDLSKWYYVLPICLIFTNWEVLRKIRAPEQETGYTTYSKIFGPRVAISIALILQIIFNVDVICIMNEVGSPLFLKIVYLLIQLILSYPSIKFLFTLKLKSLLKPNADAQILVVISFIFAAALL